MKKQRPKLPAISEQMKAWSAALVAEVARWPMVEARSFFGFHALYRKDCIFSILPRTRGMGSPNNIAFKFESPSPRIRKLLEAEPRVGITQMRAARWHTFEMSDDADLRAALEWLSRAYEAAGKSRPGGTRRK